jgi:phosphatidylinositol dimannoside acyltransferase
MIAYLYIVAWRLIRFLPLKFVIFVFSKMALKAYDRNPKGVINLRRNLGVVTKLSGIELEKLVKLGMISYARYWAEAFKLPSFSDKRIDEMVKIEHSNRLIDPTLSKQGVVVALPHLANWDLAGRWFAKRTGEVVTVAERLKPEKLFDAFVKYRRSIGLIALPANDRSTVTELRAALEAGKLVALVADRDMSSSGIEVMFCGEICTMPSGPASLAYATGSVLTTACLFNEQEYLGGFIDEPIYIDKSLPRDEAIRMATQQMADRFTVYVTSHPTDWHVLQRLWKIHA